MQIHANVYIAYEMINVNYAGFLQYRLNWPDVENRLACLLWDQSQLFLPYFFDVF